MASFSRSGNALKNFKLCSVHRGQAFERRMGRVYRVGVTVRDLTSSVVSRSVWSVFITVCTAILRMGTYIQSHTAVPSSQHPGNFTRVQPYYKSPSRNSIVFKKGWVRPRPGTIRFFPESPEISSSESSLLEERTPERPRSCSEFVTPRRVQRSIGVIQREIASGYVRSGS